MNIANWKLIPLLLLAFNFAKAKQQPNILFIAIDDLNDWIGCMGGHPQALTPNLDRLAKSGILFTNAHCPGASCNPSRTAIMTGLSPHKSGLYSNRQKMREVLPDAKLLPQHFRDHGYWAGGSGKMLHYFIDARSWDEYYPKKENEDPFPRTLYPKERPVNLPRGGPWQYVETDWAALDATDEEFGGDWLVSKWVGEKLQEKHEKPFFLACGIYRPHEPWFVPKKYFEPFPLASIQLPPGYKEDDLVDLPPAGKRRGPNRYFPHIRKHGQWKKGIQGYLASIHFADAMLGRVLDALEDGPNRDNTIVALWSDHGWHLGEKQHWQKFTVWRAVTRVPLMMKVPCGLTESLPKGTTAGSICGHPVNLLDLFPTLTKLAGLPQEPSNDGQDLLPLLKDTDAQWPHVSLTHLGEPGSYGLSAKDWRYILYDNGDEELYHTAKDPYEWHNLAAQPKHAKKLAELRKAAPKEFAPKPEPSIGSLPKLKLRTGKAPASKPDGNPFDVFFINESTKPLDLYWKTPNGGSKPYGGLEQDKPKRQQTRPGAVWEIINPKTGKPVGYFKVGDRGARAIIPAPKLSEAEVQKRPNIVVIMGDDWSWPHASILGDPVVPTPTFDRIAREGILFENAFACTPSCTPSRFSIATGQYPWRLDKAANLGGSLAADVPVYGDILAKAGYHVGFSRKGTSPSQHKYRKSDPFGKWYKDFPAFLQNRKPGQSFCYWYGAGEPHRPYDWKSSLDSDLDLDKIQVPPYLPDNCTTRTDLGDYYLKVQKLDQLAGQILHQLEKAGELQNTLVIMAGDHGMPFPRAKATLYDSGTRVPLAIRWPGKIQPGQRTTQLTSLHQLAPLFLQSAGEPLPSSMQNTPPAYPVSQPDKDAFVLLGMERHVYPNPSRAIRTQDFLLIRNTNPKSWPTGRQPGKPPTYDFSQTPWPTEPGAFSHNIDPSPTKQWMLHNDHPANRQAFGVRPKVELYDLKKDPHQLQNVAQDKAYSPTLQKLSAKLELEITQ